MCCIFLMYFFSQHKYRHRASTNFLSSITFTRNHHRYCFSVHLFQLDVDGIEIPLSYGSHDSNFYNRHPQSYILCSKAFQYSAHK